MTIDPLELEAALTRDRAEQSYSLRRSNIIVNHDAAIGEDQGGTGLTQPPQFLAPLARNCRSRLYTPRKRYGHSRIDLTRSRDRGRDCFVATDGLLNDPHILGVEPAGGIVTDEFCRNRAICAGHL